MGENFKSLGPQNQNPSGMCFCHVICWQHKNRTPPVEFLIPVLNLVHQKNGVGSSDTAVALGQSCRMSVPEWFVISGS